jgi:hypothetical protein
MKPESPEQQLDRFLSKYTPEIRALALECLEKMRKYLPGATELVYDNYNALVIGFGPTERASHALFSIALYPRWINLFFLNGIDLPDPRHLLQGDGKIVRSITIKDAALLDNSEVRVLIKEGLKRSEVPINRKAPRRLIIKSISAKQRPRRPKGAISASSSGSA